jgi:hypothetical protein
MLYSEKNSRTLHNLPYARSGICHFAADLPYFEEQVRGQIWALIYLIAEEVPRECPRACNATGKRIALIVAML